MNKDTLADNKEDNLKDLEKKCEEYLNNWKRAQADFINYKKGELERVGDLIKYEKEAMILNLLQVLDSIHLAEKHIPEHIKKDMWIEGFLQIKAQIEDLLRKENVEEVKIINDVFDPATMEIIEEVERENASSAEAWASQAGKVAEEVQKGYKMNGRVIRPAKVKISK